MSANVFHMSLNGDVRAATAGEHTVDLSSINSDASVGVGVRASYYEPGDVHSFALSGRGEPRKLTSVNADLLSTKDLGNHEEIWYEASDGSRAHGWIVKPPGFDPEKQYPLLMEIHGGPFGMYAGRFNFQYQVYAANGFVLPKALLGGSVGLVTPFITDVRR